jgi:hypothetical protein
MKGRPLLPNTKTVYDVFAVPAEVLIVQKVGLVKMTKEVLNIFPEDYLTSLSGQGYLNVEQRILAIQERQDRIDLRLNHYDPLR